MLNDFIAFIILILSTILFILIYYGIVIPEKYDSYKNKINGEYDKEIDND